MRFLLIVGLVVGTCLPVAYANQFDFFLKVISTKPLPVYHTPATNSRQVTAIPKDKIVQVVGKKDTWYNVRIQISQTGFVTGWLEANDQQVQLYRRPAKAPQQPIAPPQTQQPPLPQQEVQKTKDEFGVKESRKKKEPKQKRERKEKQPKEDRDVQSGAFLDHEGLMLRVFGAPIYNIKDYFSNTTDLQYRFGLAVEKKMGQKSWISLPVAYTTGQGFSTILGGVHGYYSPMQFGNAMMYAKLGASYEYLFSSGANFHAANIDGGLGLDFALGEKFAIGIEPISVQAMVYRTEDSIPFNVRGQVLLSVRMLW